MPLDQITVRIAQPFKCTVYLPKHTFNLSFVPLHLNDISLYLHPAVGSRFNSIQLSGSAAHFTTIPGDCHGFILKHGLAGLDILIEISSGDPQLVVAFQVSLCHSYIVVIFIHHAANLP